MVWKGRPKNLRAAFAILELEGNILAEHVAVDAASVRRYGRCRRSAYSKVITCEVMALSMRDRIGQVARERLTGPT